MDFLRIDRSFQRVKDQLDRWKDKTINELDRSCEKIFNDLDETLNFVEVFIKLTRTVLIEQENQLKTATTENEFDQIEQRIEQILREIQCLESLRFQLNIYSTELKKNFRLRFNNEELSSISIVSKKATNNFYRFLISHSDAQLIKSNSLPSEFHFDDSIFDCVLTFDVSDLDDFLRLFETFCDLNKHSSQFRLLIPDQYISFISNPSGDRLRILQRNFQLTQIKLYPHHCPKSDERLLLIEGTNHQLVRECIDEIYLNLNDRRKETLIDGKIRFYRPITNFFSDRIDYGGFLPLDDDNASLFSSESDDVWWDFQSKSDENNEIIERKMMVNNSQAGVIIGIHASCIDKIKQKSGAYVYINGETKDFKRTVIMRGTREQVNRAWTYIENLIEKHRQGKFFRTK